MARGRGRTLGQLYAVLLLSCARGGGGEASQPLSRAELLPVGSVFAGNYSCGHVPAWLLLHIEASDPLEAVFHFVYPNSGTHGAFTLREVGVEASENALAGHSQPSNGAARDPRRFELFAEEWVKVAENTEMVGMQGHVAEGSNSKRLVGTVLHSQCQQFELVRTTIDLSPASGAPPDAAGGRGSAGTQTAASARALMLHTYALVQAQLERTAKQPPSERRRLRLPLRDRESPERDAGGAGEGARVEGAEEGPH